MWIFSRENKPALTDAQRKVLAKAGAAGTALYVAGDNDPCNADATALLAVLLPGAKISGNTPGQTKLTAGDDLPEKGGGFLRESPLFTGINTLYEGFTVGAIQCPPGLEPVCQGSAGGALVAALPGSKRHGRLVVDAGFTRWFSEHYDTAGTERLGINLTAWLAGAGSARGAVTKGKE